MVLRVIAVMLVLVVGADFAIASCWDIPPEPPPAPLPEPPRGEPPPGGSPPTTPTAGLPKLPTTPGDMKNPARRPDGTGGSTVGPRTGGGMVHPEQGAPGWSSWWYYNRARFLAERAVDRAVTPVEVEEADRRPTVDWHEKAIAVLRSVLEDDRVDTSSGAAVALGKARARTALPRLARILASRDQDDSRRESAALALGMIGGEEGRDALRAVLANGKEGWRIRAFAAMGLGLTGESEALPALMRVAGARNEHREVRAAAYVAVGLLGDPMVAPLLVAAARDPDGRLDYRIRAAAVHALGRLRLPATLDDLIEVVTADRAEVRRAAVQAIGRMTGPEDWAALRALSEAARNDRDPTTRLYATIALARSGAPGVVESLKGLLAGGRMEQRGFAAVALAILARRTRDLDLRRRVTRFLHEELVSDRYTEDTRTALAIGVGITGNRGAIGFIRKMFEDGNSPGMRGHCAVALGLLDATEALPELRKAILEEKSPWAQRELAIALGVLEDGPSIEALSHQVRQGKSEHSRGNAALALGQIATPNAAGAMIEILANERSTSGPTRRKVAHALGHVLDVRPLPTLFPVLEDFDYGLDLQTFHLLLHLL